MAAASPGSAPTPSAAPAFPGGAAVGRNTVPLRQQIFAAMAVLGCSRRLAQEQGKAQPSPPRPIPPATVDVTESQNHRIVGVGRDLCGSSSPTPLTNQGHLQ